MSTFKPHWQVQPQSIRVSLSEVEQRISLSLHGDVDAPVFASSNPDIVQIDANGVVRCGSVAGNAMVMVWRSVLRDSLRHVMVEVRDLDSHLIGPTPAGGEFHVFYSHKIENEAAELDVDDTSSYGLETITIYQLIPATYR